jgi:predicted nucleotidyltransferase
MNIIELAKKHQKSWKNIEECESLSNKIHQQIRGLFSELSMPLFSSDEDLVVFGSLARNECNSNSDIDWTLLVDGQTKPSHSDIKENIKSKLEEAGFDSPGTTEMFGNFSYSHELTNIIGGSSDTNHNLSKRILLLLESDKIPLNLSDDNSGTAYERVIRGIIERYIDNDSSFSSVRGKTANVPRFLLNDIVRFWRTVCVDFANKQAEQGGKKWALRNIKLRMSRKLIYTKGILMCFNSYNDPQLSQDIVKENLRKIVSQKPLNFVIEFLTKQGINEKYLLELLDSYDSFLGMLNNEDLRNRFASLNMVNAYKDSEFEKAREISHNFQNSINDIFFAEDTNLKEYILKYIIY